MTTSNIRYLRVTGAVLDGTTPLTTDYSPEAGARNQPYSWVDQATIGRISPKRWLSFGSLGALVIAKCWVASPDGPVTLTSRSPTEDELEELSPAADVPVVPPVSAQDQLLESRSVVPSTWSTPILLSPEHAITLLQPGDGPERRAGNTVELLLIDVDNPGAFTFLNGLLSGVCCGEDTEAFVTVVTEAQAIQPFAGTQYLLANPANPSMVLALPPVADVEEGTTLVITRIGGGWVQIIANGAETVNGQVEPLVITDFGQITFTKRGGAWISSESPLTAGLTLSNAVADATVPLPISTGTVYVGVNFTERGTLQLPLLANVGPGVEYLLARTTDNATIPRAVRVIPQAGESINGLADAVLALGNPGAVLRLRSHFDAGAIGWAIVSDRQSTQSQALTYAVDTTLDSGWIGEKLIRATLSTTQTITLPAAATLFVGTKISVAYLGGGLGAAGLTVLAGASAIVAGGQTYTGAAGVRLFRDDTAMFTWDGAAWQGIVGATIPQTIIAVDNAASTFAEGWNGLRIVRCTQIALQIVTLPPPAVCPVGMQIQVVPKGAGGVSIAGNGAQISSGGAVGATLARAIDTPVRLVYDGLEWSSS